MAKATKPIPEGYHTATPQLIVPNAVEAIAFYKKAFGAEEVMRMPGPDGKSTMHAEIRIGDSMIFVGDENPRWDAKSPKTLGGSPMTLNLYVADADASFKRALDAGATVKMPLDDMFWGDRFGKVTDPYGFTWGIATHKVDVPPAEMEKAAREWMKKMGM